MACAGSTDPARPIDLSRPYELDPSVALREEPFGALAYHYGNRRLNFLRSPELVRIVRSLSEHDSLADALTTAGVGGSRRQGYESALATLLEREVIRAR
jgi:putative mycofactocin binding protein MftB